VADGSASGSLNNLATTQSSGWDLNQSDNEASASVFVIIPLHWTYLPITVKP
jgi:hypothetical protein